MSNYLLTMLILVPLAAALFSSAVPATRVSWFRSITLAAQVAQVVLLVALIVSFNPQTNNEELQLRAPWLRIPAGAVGMLKADFALAVDGLSLSLIALSVVILLVATFASWKVVEKAKGYFILLLVLNAALIGTFSAMDLLLFFLFFEFILLPMYFLIGIWGGPRREYASIKFFIYTLVGSVLILTAIIILYAAGGTFYIPELIAQPFAGSVLQPGYAAWIGGISLRGWVFLLFIIGFGIKLPVFPFHTWLPDAHVEASTAISVILAALLLKVGGYGMARVVFPIFPAEARQFSWLLGFTAVITIVYGAFNALAAKDLKRLVAYSSVSHMGFVLLGLASGTVAGVAGSIYQMVSHGIISAMLFLLVGVLYDRTHDRQIASYSGLQAVMPRFTAMILIAFFASLGLPGFSGFIAEFLTLAGAFQSPTLNHLIPQWMPMVAIAGIVITAAFYTWTIQRMFFGAFYCRADLVPADLSAREKIMLYPLGVIAMVLGIFPQPLLNWINPFGDFLSRLLTLPN